MPRVKSVTAEVGSSGNTATVVIGDNVADAIGEAVEIEHVCDSNVCDIAAAMRHGYPHVAAHLLQSATETPLLDAVLSAVRREIRPALIPDVTGWPEWVETFKALTIKCPGCDAYVWQDEDGSYCDNCLGEIPQAESEED